MAEKILAIRNLNKQFVTKRNMWGKAKQYTKAVSDVSLDIYEGETLGIVGESGCGKSTLCRCIVRGIDSTSGEVLYTKTDGSQVDFLKSQRDEYKEIRKEIQMIFQDPFSSLDPRMTVYDILSEPLKAGFHLKRQEIEKELQNIADMVVIDKKYLKRYPHAFSGGQRQRISIARALVTNPRIIACDEAVSALDVSIQAQIINLLRRLKEHLQITYIFVSHDLSVVENISDRVVIMYLGKIVELAQTNDIFFRPKHPYTETLLSAVPVIEKEYKMEKIISQGEIPSATKVPSGCAFHTRCRFVQDKCRAVEPELRKTEDGRFIACHFYDELKLQGIKKRVEPCNAKIAK